MWLRSEGQRPSPIPSLCHTVLGVSGRALEQQVSPPRWVQIPSGSPGELPSRSAHGPPYAGEPLPWCRGNSPRGHPNSLPRCTPPPPYAFSSEQHLRYSLHAAANCMHLAMSARLACAPAQLHTDDRPARPLARPHVVSRLLISGSGTKA